MDAWLKLQALPEFWTAGPTNILIFVTIVAIGIVVLAAVKGFGEIEVIALFVAFTFMIGYGALLFHIDHGRNNAKEMKSIIARHVEEVEGVTSSNTMDLLSASGENVKSNYQTAQNAAFRGINKEGELVDVEVSWLGLGTEMTQEPISNDSSPIVIKVTPVEPSSKEN